jgi:hypothetical protein
LTSRDPLIEAVRSLESEIGLEAGFVEALLKEPNDWSFVVKIHAISEAALTHVIVEALGRPELREVVGHINMGDTRAGKLVIAERLGLLGEPSIKFLREVATMRNRFVHGVRHINLRIEEFAATLKPKDAERLWQALADG